MEAGVGGWEPTPDLQKHEFDDGGIVSDVEAVHCVLACIVGGLHV